MLGGGVCFPLTVMATCDLWGTCSKGPPKDQSQRETAILLVSALSLQIMCFWTWLQGHQEASLGSPSGGRALWKHHYLPDTGEPQWRPLFSVKRLLTQTLFTLLLSTLLGCAAFLPHPYPQLCSCRKCLLPVFLHSLGWTTSFWVRLWVVYTFLSSGVPVYSPLDV